MGSATAPCEIVRKVLPRVTLDDLFKRIDDYRRVLLQKKGQKAAAKHPGTVALADELRASPLTMNIEARMLKLYKSAEILNGFEVEARYGSPTGNVSKSDSYDLRLYAEHQAYGFPFHAATTSHGEEPERVRAWTDVCKVTAEVGSPLPLAGCSAYRVPPSLRPRYAALDYRDSGCGATPDPYYGLSFFHFADALKQRATFTLGDSWDAFSEQEDSVFTLDTLELMLLKAAALNEKKLISHLARRANLGPSDLLPIFANLLDEELANAPYKAGDQYIELQIFGPIAFTDIQSVNLSRAEIKHEALPKARHELDPASILQSPTWNLVA